MGRSIKVVERKLGREKAVGIAYDETNEVHIDPRQGAREYFNTCAHELTHLLFPEMSEKQVIKTANKMTRFFWKMGFRKVDLK